MGKASKKRRGTVGLLLGEGAGWSISFSFKTNIQFQNVSL